MKINFTNLVRQLTPVHKRQPMRLALLRAFIAPLQLLFDNFNQWRSDTRMTINVNSQVKILEEYLRRKYNEPISIKIVTFDDGLLMVCLESEGQLMMPEIGYTDEKMADLPLSGEIREQFGDCDFIVYIPAGLELDLIRAEIEKYKQALIAYNIIQN